MSRNLRPLRDYQMAAVDAVTRALADGGSGQLHMACGTGKSLTAQRITETLLAPIAADRCAVAAVITPSLTLVKQFLDSWKEDAELGPIDLLAVCSDQTVTEADAAAHASELGARVTTSPTAISDRLRRLPNRGLLLIVSTYASAHQLAEGLRHAGCVLDLLICDEAHHLAGMPSPQLRQLVTEQQWLPTHSRIFMTATPRLFTDSAAERGALSMDDHDLFGEVLYSYSFPQAIADGYLDDYRALVTVVEDHDVRKVLDSLNDQLGEEGHRAIRSTVVAQVALLRSWQEQGAGRSIAFCDSIRGSKQFTSQLPQVAALLGLDPGMVEAVHVDGTMRSEQRDQILAKLATEPDGRLVVVSNARCLSEGVDVPSVDAVLFACPKRSEIDIVQAAGRALRRSPDGQGVAKFILPILLPAAEEGELTPSLLSGTDYEPTWTIIRALRDIDSDLGAALDRVRMSQQEAGGESKGLDWRDLPEKIVMSGQVPAAAILRQIAVAIIGHSTSGWLDGLAALKAFHTEHGHFEAPASIELTDRSTLQGWVKRQRLRRSLNELPADRVAALDAIGFEWAAGDMMWMYMLSRYVTHVAMGSSADVPESLVLPGGIRLGQWVRDQRVAYAKGQLPVHRARALECTGLQLQIADLEPFAVELPAAVAAPPAGPFTAVQLARLAGCSDVWVRKAIRSGELRGRRTIRGAWLIDEGAAAAWIAARNDRAQQMHQQTLNHRRSHA